MLKFSLRYFTIVGSKLLRKQSKYHVIASTHQLKKSIDLQLKIRNTKGSESETIDYEKVKTFTLENGKTQKVEFDVSIIKYDLEFTRFNNNFFMIYHLFF